VAELVEGGGLESNLAREIDLTRQLAEMTALTHDVPTPQCVRPRWGVFVEGNAREHGGALRDTEIVAKPWQALLRSFPPGDFA
jgi:hypothetical protein